MDSFFGSDEGSAEGMDLMDFDAPAPPKKAEAPKPKVVVPEKSSNE